MKFAASVAALIVSLPSAGFCADAAAPVGEIVAAATVNWQEMGSDMDTPPEYRDYFSADFLGRVYSRDFAEKYRAATNYPAYDEGDSPFDYDPIVGGQDGCPLKDVKTQTGVAEGGVTAVTVSFDNTHCFGERAADWTPTTLVFTVIEEAGRAVVDDIDRLFFVEGASLKGELERIVTDGAAAAAGGTAQ
ncbi:hypothetical protein LXM94_07020 [Rhizobium sp. TRM95111]|uniref:hypothetical protein n=1 Tax=Rhizobium alarense TaxID=2846851 RepID=UPI001F292B2E|nr:hypothetical protein [Rhizobium alarense]MCF3639719.1 hypothetical protein [Rhizobium alarense]